MDSGSESSSGVSGVQWDTLQSHMCVPVSGHTLVAVDGDCGKNSARPTKCPKAPSLQKMQM